MTLLLLAGTSEAQQIARVLVQEGVSAIASLAGSTRQPAPTGLPTHSGGFGGEDGFRSFVRDNDITAVLDATHPFAYRISMRTARICAEQNIPYCQLLRPAWTPGPDDLWTQVAKEEDVARYVAPGETVFLATGRKTLDRFANLAGNRLICRQIDPPDRPFPFPNGEYLIGRPPFSVEAEVDLFKQLGVDWLVVKNAGGEASTSKLVAAQQLGIKVAMIARPPQPDAPAVETVEAALEWARGP